MFEFLDKLFQSELIKNNWFAFSVCSLLLVALGGVSVWLYHRFFKNKHIHDKLTATLKEFNDTKKQLSELEKRNDELNEKLRKYDIMEQIVDDKESDELDPPIIPFIKK